MLAYIEKPTRLKRFTVWCGFWSRGIIGQFFFENEQGEAVTVNGDRYRAMLNEFKFTIAIGHRWTIICGVPSKISVKPTSQRQMTLLTLDFCALFLKIALSAQS